MRGYDAWLEAPYQQMMEESDKFYDWCEEFEYDVDSPEAEAAYMEWMDEHWAGYVDVEGDFDDYDFDYELDVPDA